MKRSQLLVILLIPILMLWMLSLNNYEQYIVGRINILSAGISAEIMSSEIGSDCGCCGVLWNGGIVTTQSDLSNVCLYDTAKLATFDGGHYVLECVEITPYIRVGNLLINWYGVIQEYGDVLVTSGGMVYRFSRL